MSREGTPVCAVVLLVALVLSSGNARGQTSASIVGQIKDSSAALLPGAGVTVTRTETGSVRLTTTSDVGNYRVTNLPPGAYTVAVSLVGFKTSVAEVELTVGEVAHVELTLQLGEIAEEVFVVGAETAVNVEQGRVSALVDEDEIVNLPLNGRNVYQLMHLTPGAVDSRATIYEPGQGATVNGGRANMNGFWMDGITSKGLSGGVAGEGSGIWAPPNLEAVQEFRIETLNFSAEFGNSAAAAVSVVSKSGSNEFHGSVYEFHRNAALDARVFFDEERPHFIQNQFGFSLGGPIVKNRTFFFGSYEGTRIRRGLTRIRELESAQWANYVSAHGAPVARFVHANYPGPALDQVHSNAGEYLQSAGYVDSADQASVDDVLGSLFGSPPGAFSASTPMVGEANFQVSRPVDFDGYTLRVDHELGEADHLFGRYFLTDGHTERPAFRNGLGVGITAGTHQGSLHWTRILSPRVINEARTGLTRATDVWQPYVRLPYIVDASFISEFGSDSPSDWAENTLTWADTLSLNAGSHGLKLGGEVRRNQENSEFDVGGSTYYFFDLVYLALDDPYYQFVGVDPRLDQGPGRAELASNARGWRGTEIGVFFNDDWKLRPNLTLNLGLRWDWYGRLTEVQNRATAYDLSQGSDIFERFYNGRFIGPVDKLSEDDWNNVAPRIGFAWDPFSDGEMSVRGGFGIAYQSGIYNPLSNSRWNKPFYAFGLAAPLFGIGNSIIYGPQDGSEVRVDGPNPNPGASTRTGNITGWDGTNPNYTFLSGIPNPAMRDPYVMSLFLGIQRELWTETTLEVNYVGTLGRKLIRAENFNRYVGDWLGAPHPVTGEHEGDLSLNRINSEEGELRCWENSVNSNYHALQVQLDRRYGAGLALNLHYTLAKSLDTRSTWHSFGTTPNWDQEGFSTDVTKVWLDYGRSIFDARHRFVASWLWEPPWFAGHERWFLRHVLGGWQVNGIVSLQSGQPFTAWTFLPFRRGGDFNADGVRNDRPNTPAVGNSISSDRSDFVNPNAGIFNIPSSNPGSPPSEEDILAYFGTPELGTNGNLGRNTYNGPGYANADFSLFKEVKVPALGESGLLQLRFEFFNLFNRVNLEQPETYIDAFGFGRSLGTFDAREIQLGVKLLF